MNRFQAILRQINIDSLLVTEFMKNVYYNQLQHETTFEQILELLFYYCLNNTIN